MLFQVTKGSIEDHANLEISCEELFLMDFGDATFTSFEASTDWITFFEEFPQVNPVTRTLDSKWYIGKIHSHHNMSAYHSSVDTADLYENAPKLPFFLSLVVNYACQPFAEIAVAGTIEQKQITRNKWSLKNFVGFGDNKIEKKNEKKPLTYIIPCDTLYLTQQSILDQIALVKERNKKPVYSYTPVNTNYQSPGYQEPGKKKEDNKKQAPIGYKLVLDHLSELFLLGTGIYATKTTAPSVIFLYIDHLLTLAEQDRYFDAFKVYFLNEWFEDHFKKTTYTEEEIIDCILHFLSLDANKHEWITKNFNRSLYEFKDEVKLLRAVQGNALVQTD